MLSAIQDVSQLSSTNTKRRVTVYSGSAGNYGIAYIVPDGKSFSGYLIPVTPGNYSFYLNGISHDHVCSSATVFTPFPIFLKSGDVVANYSTISYFTITGIEE